jgi:crotonobetainyl-CoA:carnitine CoA-transferase CaiB-like acyl-CoA transferase
VEDKFWAQFCQKLDRAEYVKPQWNPDLQADIQSDIREIMLTKTRDEWVEFFANDDICFTPVLTMEEMCNHPQVAARDMILKLANFKGSGREIPLTGVPIKLSGTPGAAKLEFPALGQDTEAILRKIGYSDQQVAEFRQKGII